MATLQKIRSKGSFLVAIIGLALLAFIAGDVMNSMQSIANESRQQIGEVYGKKISVLEFQDLVDEYTEVVKFTSGNNTLTDEALAQIRDQVWYTYVNTQLIAHEAELLGLTVTDKELQDIYVEGTNPILMQTPFRNEQTGRFEYDKAQKFLIDYKEMQSNMEQMPVEYIEYYESMYKFWMFIEKTIKQNCLAQKYQALLSKSLLSNKVVNEMSFEARTNESDVIMAALPYSTVKDTDIKVEESDLKAKYNELKEQFKQTVETRDIKYISIQVKASAADKAALDKEMEETAQALSQEGCDVARIVRETSNIAYSPIPVSKNVFPTDIATQLESMTVGEMKAPYFNAGDNTMNIIKLIGKVSAPDSIEYRQIQVAGADINVIRLTADSIMTALKSGVAFDSIAKKYNQTGAKMWLTSNQYEGSNFSPDNLKYIKALTTMSTNAVQKIEFSQGCIIAQVTARRAMIDKYDVAVVKRTVEFSNETYAKAYNDFSQFVAANQSLDSIEANALKSNYNLLDRKNVNSSEHNVANVKNTRDALRWIFNEDTEVGNVSPLYECGENDNMLVVVLTGIHEKGYRTLDDAEVKEYITTEVIKDKKAEMLKTQMEGKTLADVVKMEGAVSDTIKHITFNSPTFVMKTASSEPVLSAVASKLESGKQSQPFQGNAAVYTVQVINKSKSAEKFDATKEETQQETMNMRAISRFANDLSEKADIVDNRYLFF